MTVPESVRGPGSLAHTGARWHVSPAHLLAGLPAWLGEIHRGSPCPTWMQLYSAVGPPASEAMRPDGFSQAAQPWPDFPASPQDNPSLPSRVPRQSESHGLDPTLRVRELFPAQGYGLYAPVPAQESQTLLLHASAT